MFDDNGKKTKMGQGVYSAFAYGVILTDDEYKIIYGEDAGGEGAGILDAFAEKDFLHRSYESPERYFGTYAAVTDNNVLRREEEQSGSVRYLHYGAWEIATLETVIPLNSAKQTWQRFADFAKSQGLTFEREPKLYFITDWD